MIIRKILNIVKLVLLKIKWTRINKHNSTIPGTIFRLNNVNVGRYTYGVLNVYDFGADNEKLQIGSFVSIAEDVKFVLGGNHRYKTLLTYPIRVNFLSEKQEALSKGPIIVEDDVWIGFDSVILSGVRVGRGSIIAARSLVVTDIPPYSIAGGIPAKVIKYRFEPEIIEKLKSLDYSRIDEKFCENNMDLLYNDLTSGNLDKILRNLS